MKRERARRGLKRAARIAERSSSPPNHAGRPGARKRPPRHAEEPRPLPPPAELPPDAAVAARKPPSSAVNWLLMRQSYV